MGVRAMATDFLADATGRGHRRDPVLPSTGGPAGNARLTAWTGVVLLVLFLVELVTLLDVHSLVSWHIVVGVLLIPPALLKTGTTIWRFTRYYLGSTPYLTSGPPPLLLRILGPLVVLSTLAVLGTGLALVFIDPTTARRPITPIGPFFLNLLAFHKAAFAVWLIATGIHVLGRLIPALKLTVMRAPQRVGGGRLRVAALALTLVVAVLAGVIALSLAGPWQDRSDRPERKFPRSAPTISVSEEPKI